MKLNLSRRHFLRAVGMTLALPALESVPLASAVQRLSVLRGRREESFVWAPTSVCTLPRFFQARRVLILA